MCEYFGVTEKICVLSTSQLCLLQNLRFYIIADDRRVAIIGQLNDRCRSLSIADTCFHLIARTTVYRSAETTTNLESSIKMICEPMLIELNAHM